MWAFFFSKRQTQMETDIRRLRHEIEQIKNDAVARGVLLNEIWKELNDGDRTVRNRSAASKTK